MVMFLGFGSLGAFLGKAVLPGAISLGSQLLSGKQRRNQYGKQRAHNLQMAKYEWQKNLEMWNRQNEYNHPMAQMARFEQAGLNPNLIYGQGTPGNAQQMPQFMAPQQPVDKQPLINPMEGIMKVLEAQMKSAQTRQEREKAKQQAIDTWIKQNTSHETVNQARLETVFKGIQNSIARSNEKIKGTEATMSEDYLLNSSDWLPVRMGVIALKEVSAIVGAKWPQWKKKIISELKKVMPDIDVTQFINGILQPFN